MQGTRLAVFNGRSLYGASADGSLLSGPFRCLRVIRRLIGNRVISRLDPGPVSRERSPRVDRSNEQLALLNTHKISPPEVPPGALRPGVFWLRDFPSPPSSCNQHELRLPPGKLPWLPGIHFGCRLQGRKSPVHRLHHRRLRNPPQALLLRRLWDSCGRRPQRCCRQDRAIFSDRIQRPIRELNKP